MLHVSILHILYSNKRQWFYNPTIITTKLTVQLKLISLFQGRNQRGLPGCSPPPNHLKLKIKKTDFVDIILSKVLRDFHFSRNQPLKLADENCIRILKNKLMK
jgi:hypothetical protein